ncbi:MAG: hypothetical protein Q9190_000018 [Brigantiaea leucoxantha]
MNAPITHDLSRKGCHVKDVETFGKILTNAALNAFPNKQKPPRYKQDVFSRLYRFNTEEWQIPSDRAHNALALRLMQFLEHEHEDHLLIVYYGGHGGMNDDRQCMWSCHETPDSPTVQWYALQTILEQAKSDVLILLDCCAAASAAAASGNSITEVIAACGSETWAPGVNQHSFSRSLIEDSNTLPLKPRFHSDLDQERRRTPIYIQLANDTNKRSIQLAPMSQVADAMDVLEIPDNSQTQSASPSSSEDVDMLSSISSPSMTKVWPDPQFSCPKVMISVALEDDQRLEIGEWNSWLEAVPALVKYAKVVGVYKSNSILMMLLLPVAIWDLLPKHPTINFVGFVLSENMIDDRQNADQIKKSFSLATKPFLDILSRVRARRDKREIKPHTKSRELLQPARQTQLPLRDIGAQGYGIDKSEGSASSTKTFELLVEHVNARPTGMQMKESSLSPLVQAAVDRFGKTDSTGSWILISEEKVESIRKPNFLSIPGYHGPQMDGQLIYIRMISNNLELLQEAQRSAVTKIEAIKKNTLFP